MTRISTLREAKTCPERSRFEIPSGYLRDLETGEEGAPSVGSKLPDGEKREKLQSWVSNDLVMRFGQRLVEIDAEIAWAWGTLLGEAEKRGEKLPVVDSLIAVTASVHGLIVVTRNVQDMARCQAKVFNPWESQPDR